MWIREISQVEMDMLGAEKKSSTKESGSQGGPPRKDFTKIIEGIEPISVLRPEDVVSPDFIKEVKKIKSEDRKMDLLSSMTSDQAKKVTSRPDLILDDDIIAPAKNSESGVNNALRRLRSVRTKIQALDVALKFLKSIGKIEGSKLRDASKRKNGKVDKSAVKKAAADVAGAVAWKTAVTAFPVLAIVKGVAEKVIETVMERMKINYNNNCGGKAGELMERGGIEIADFSKVGKAGRQDGKCDAAKGEPEWISEGFQPYLWKGGLGLTRWNYTTIGISRNKKQIKDALERRKKRGKKAPPQFKGGDRNMDMRPPAACRPDRVG